MGAVLTSCFFVGLFLQPETDFFGRPIQRVAAAPGRWQRDMGTMGAALGGSLDLTWMPKLGFCLQMLNGGGEISGMGIFEGTAP